MLYGMALIITVVMVSCGIYFFVRQALAGQIENHLSKDIASITQFLKHDLANLEKVAEHGPVHLFTVQQGGRAIVASREWKMHDFDTALKDGRTFPAPESITGANGGRYLLQSSRVDVGGTTYLITAGHNEGSVRQALRTLAQIILLILPISVAISLAVGYLIAGRVLAPISDITRKAEEIGAENLSERLPVNESNDEFSRLATVFNQTFARIEDSFLRLKHFSADASHELRTPLAAIRSIGETALHAQDEQGNCREAIGSILEETDRLRQLIDALLQLSRADGGEIRQRREAVDLAELVRDTVEFLNVLAEEKHQNIKLAVNAKAIAQIDPASGRQALTNLLDNAIKYSPPESNISISVGVTSRNEAFVEIADCGAGIPESDIERIFDRFYRVDKGRSREMGGAGLGLSITKWAVESNGGRIEVESVLNKGSVFRVIFPA